MIVPVSEEERISNSGFLFCVERIIVTMERMEMTRHEHYSSLKSNKQICQRSFILLLLRFGSASGGQSERDLDVVVDEPKKEKRGHVRWPIRCAH
jgi:hypothetical protein